MRALALCLVLIGLSFAAPARAQTTGFERAFQTGEARLAEFDIDGARTAFEAALATSTSTEQRAKVLDRVGAIDGIDRRYWSAFKSFLEAADLGGPERVKSVDHPQIPTRRMASCAVRFHLARLSADDASDMFRELLKLEPQDDLEQALENALFTDEFVCPDVQPPKPELDPSLLLVEEGIRPPPAATWILGGAALAAVGTGITLGLVAQAEAEDARAATFQSDVDRAENQVIAANIAYGVAGVAAASAILFWVFDEGAKGPNPELPPTLITANGVRVRF